MGATRGLLNVVIVIQPVIARSLMASTSPPAVGTMLYRYGRCLHRVMYCNQSVQTWALLNSTSVGRVKSRATTPIWPEVRVESVTLVI